jgi:hypothetical protein
VETLNSMAGRLMEAMESGARAGMTVDDWVVFVGPEGGYQMIAGYEGSLESLAWERGARKAWRMLRRDAEVVVEGRDGAGRCEMRTPLPRTGVKHLVQQAAIYSI